MKVKSEREVAQSSPTVRDPMDRNPQGSSFPGILQARVLEWDAIAFSICELIVLIFREGDGTPLQYSSLENPMDRGAW